MPKTKIYLSFHHIGRIYVNEHSMTATKLHILNYVKLAYSYSPKHCCHFLSLFTLKSRLAYTNDKKFF